MAVLELAMPDETGRFSSKDEDSAVTQQNAVTASLSCSHNPLYDSDATFSLDDFDATSWTIGAASWTSSTKLWVFIAFFV